jgi:hypothetical protein
MAFTVAVIIVATLVAGGDESPQWVHVMPLLPLGLLLTGLYLFVLPYASGWRIGRSAD